MKRSDCISSGWAMLLTVIHLPKRLSCTRMLRRCAGVLAWTAWLPRRVRRACIFLRTLKYSMNSPAARLIRMEATSGTSDWLKSDTSMGATKLATPRYMRTMLGTRKSSKASMMPR